MALLWVVGTRRRDVGIVDVFWGLGFSMTAWCAAAMNGPPAWRVVVAACLTTVWGLRLSLHLLRRNRGREEDRRYAAMRKQWGPRFTWVSLATVFLLQAALLWFIAWPLQVLAVTNSRDPFGALDAAGIGLWAFGFCFEAVGDLQLARFRADPRNSRRVLDRGLWRYTRHPNYFGDFCVWWGLYFLSAGGGASWTIASPVVMSWLLLRVSGVALLESTIRDRRPEYAAYQARTNAFFPGPPKKGAAETDAT
jgi:steroid 5-alpha reductase family enzyme